MTEKQTVTAPTFEEAIAELEELVRRMEEGRLSLEDSVQAYTRGMELVKLCRCKLDDAENRVKQLEEEHGSEAQ